MAASAAYSAGGAATTLSSGTTVSDPESANLVSGTVSIASGFLTGDTLAATTTGTSITASYNASTGVLSLSGSDTLAHYQQVLDSVTYSSSNQNPTNSGADPSRTISWVVNDGTVNSATADHHRQSYRRADDVQPVQRQRHARHDNGKRPQRGRSRGQVPSLDQRHD